MSTDDDSDDSLLRALAVAPPVQPPPRLVTAMLIQLSAVAPAADQLASVRALVGSQDAELTERDDGMICVIWKDAALAAACALELRDALPETRIALATGSTDAGGPAVVARIVERAVAIVVAGVQRVNVDESTAALIEKKFELELADDGSMIVLVEPMASGTPALTGKVIGNYKIVQLLGTGGMGIVYLAEHITLGRKAVIKFVQERLTKDIGYTQRFFTEAKTAASIRHPGIVDVFDYGKDDTGRGYIVMELLEGESLRTRLRREKPLKPELAITLAAQMASAVGSAHAAGVIHRDLKPDNLFLVPDTESVHRIRAKVLDFGLAKVTTADAGPAVTQSGNFVGTPLYMSPEQCRSKAGVDHRTDIYSLGCILFEMVCGRPPFVDKTVGDLIIAHNTVAPPKPSDLIPSITPALERAILRALAKHPDERFATMDEFYSVLSQLAPQATGAPPLDKTALARPRGFSEPPPISAGAQRASAVSAIVTKPPKAPNARMRRGFVMGGAVTLVLAVVAGGFLLGGTKDKQPAAAIGGRRAIAIVELANSGNKTQTAWLATAIGEVVTSDLQSVKDVFVLPADEVTRMNAELSGASGWNAENLSRMRSVLGANYVIAGSYLALDGVGQLRVDVVLYDTSTGAELARISESGQESDLIGLGARVATGVKRELGVATGEVSPSPIAVLPSKAGAARLYAEGLSKLRRLETVEARDLLAKASVEEPNDPLIHSALVTVWRELGYDNRAKTEAKLAYDFASSLPRENQLAIEAQYRESTGQWEQAIKAYQTLFEFFPGRIDYGLALAAAQTHSGDAKSAYATLAMLRKQAYPIGSDPRIDLAEAKAAEEADDMERVRVNAERAALFARKRGARHLLAKALLKQGWALWTLGRDDEALPIYDEAKQIFVSLGDRGGLAATLNNIGLAHHRKHRDSDATRTFAEGLKLAEEIGDTQTQAWILHNWGYVLADAGDLTKALELTQRKLELGGERGDAPSSQAAAHVNISEILRWRGDLAGARRHCEEAEDLLRGLDARRFASYAALHCGEVLRAEDDLPGAKKRFQQAVGWASDVMTPAESAEMRIAMARAELDDVRAVEAEALARAAVADLRAAKELSQQVCGVAVLASALLARTQVAEAAKEIEAVASLPGEGVSFACRLESEIAAARVGAAVDPAQTPAMLAMLEATRKRAEAATFVQAANHARLAIGRLQGAAGTDTLRKLAQDAGSRGFKLVARLAKQSAK